MFWKEEVKNYTNVKLVSVPWPVTDKKDSPRFAVLWDNYELTDKYFTQIKWKVTWIKSTFTPKKWKMWDIYWFKVFISDIENPNNVLVIESTITNASKDLLNALINSKDKVVNISLYLNKNGYPTASVKTEDGNFIQWALDFKTLNWETLKAKVDEVFKSSEQEIKSNDINLEDIPF